MRTPFFNPNEAGRLLAENLTFYANREDVIVLALPRRRSTDNEVRNLLARTVYHHPVEA
jgi:hypothetical protein